MFQVGMSRMSNSSTVSFLLSLLYSGNSITLCHQTWKCHLRSSYKTGTSLFPQVKLDRKKVKKINMKNKVITFLYILFCLSNQFLLINLLSEMVFIHDMNPCKKIICLMSLGTSIGNFLILQELENIFYLLGFDIFIRNWKMRFYFFTFYYNRKTNDQLIHFCLCCTPKGFVFFVVFCSTIKYIKETKLRL